MSPEIWSHTTAPSSGHTVPSTSLNLPSEPVVREDEATGSNRYCVRKGAPHPSTTLRSCRTESTTSPLKGTLAPQSCNDTADIRGRCVRPLRRGVHVSLHRVGEPGDVARPYRHPGAHSSDFRPHPE